MGRSIPVGEWYGCQGNYAKCPDIYYYDWYIWRKETGINRGKEKREKCEERLQSLEDISVRQWCGCEELRLMLIWSILKKR